MAEATALGSRIAGGWGRGAPVRPADLLFVRQAIREDWDVPQGVRGAVVRDVTALLDDPATRARMLNATTWALLAMEQDNLKLLDDRRCRALESVAFHLTGRKPTRSMIDGVDEPTLSLGTGTRRETGRDISPGRSRAHAHRDADGRVSQTGIYRFALLIDFSQIPQWPTFFAIVRNDCNRASE